MYPKKIILFNDVSEIRTLNLYYATELNSRIKI